MSEILDPPGPEEDPPAPGEIVAGQDDPVGPLDDEQLKNVGRSAFGLAYGTEENEKRMRQKRFDVYIWVTWLTSLLAGDASCWHQPWLKSHFKITKIDNGGFDLAAWKVQHTEMVEQRAAALTADGWTVTLEDQNFFTLVGRVAKLAGKPDIVAIKGSDALCVDCKSGQRRASDIQQVLLYMFALPLASDRFKHLRLAGEVQYLDGSIPISPEQFSDELRARIIAAVTKIGSSTVPPTTPSARECAFCDVSIVDCPARIERAVEETKVEVF